MVFDTIIYEKKENIAWITLNRPEVLNAQNDVLRAELIEAVDDSKKDDEVQVIVITGAGDKAFSAGGDISMFTELTLSDAINLFRGERRAVSVVRETLKPIIAMVNGLAVGGGFELAMACDLIIASDNARFGLPEIKVGQIPGGGGTQMLTRLAGEKKAKELIFTGDLISAKEALDLGIVNQVVPSENLKNAVENIIKKLKSKSQVILKIAKIAVNKALETTLHSGLESEKELFAMCFGTQDQKEGVRAFLKKEHPVFKGK